MCAWLESPLGTKLGSPVLTAAPSWRAVQRQLVPHTSSGSAAMATPPHDSARLCAGLSSAALEKADVNENTWWIGSHLTCSGGCISDK